MARIVILTSEFPPFRGGIGTYALELATAAQSSGHSVTVVAPDFGEDCRNIDCTFPFAVLRYADGAADLRGLPKRFKATWRALRGARADIVHAADWPFFIPVRVLSGLRARCIVTLHGSEVRYMQAPKRRYILDALGFWKAGWAKWISNSRYTHDLALGAFPIRPEDALPIPLGVSKHWCDGRVDRDEARRQVGVADDRLVIVSLGRVVQRKGHLVLAEALALLPDALRRRIEWRIIGPLIDTDFAAALRARLETLDVRTEVLGALPGAEVRTHMSAADLFCLPGFEDNGVVEGFGLVFLEAAAYAVPSIATKSGGIPDAIDDGVTGLLVPERDPQALSAAIARILGDDELRARMADAALARASASTWTTVMERTYV